MHIGQLGLRLSVGLALALAGCPSSDDPCVRAICLETLPWQGTGSPRVAEAGDVARHGCGGTTFAEDDVLYHLELDEPGFLAAEATPVDGAPSPSLHLLGALPEEACLDGRQGRAGGLLGPGGYWLVVDGEASAESYHLEVGFTTEADLAALALHEAAAHDALAVFAAAWERHDTERFEYVITDFSLHSALERQWIFELSRERLRFHLQVAHGRGSNELFVDTAYPPGFSNTEGTYLSSLGVMRSGEAYQGAYGSSYRIDGLEPGINDHVRQRAIVMHPWAGSRPEFVAEHGEVEPTWGCPALDDRVAPMVAERLSNGVLMFFWHPEWREQSTYLGSWSGPGRP